MYGLVNIAIKDLVLERFGESTWEEMRTKANVDDQFVNFNQYPDDITYKLVTVASEMLGVSEDDVYELYGVYWVLWTMRSGHDALFKTLGDTLPSFLSNLDFLHSVYMKTMYADMTVPQFRVEDVDGETILLHYISSRFNMWAVVAGAVKGVARFIFNTKINVEKVGFQEEYYMDIRKSHYILKITYMEFDLPSMGVTAGEILKQDWTNVAGDQNDKETEEIIPTKNTKCPFSTDMKVDNKTKSLGLSIISAGKIEASVGLGGKFAPKIPERVLLDGHTFITAFPYHVVFDKNMVVKHCGLKMQEICPGLNKDGAQLNDFMFLRHPLIELCVDNIQVFINNIFMAEIKKEVMSALYQNKPPMSVRGQMVWMEQCGLMAFLCSPRITSLEELKTREMHFSDIAPHDITRDLILFNQQRIAEVELAKQLEEKKEQLRVTMRDLEVEKKKTDTLLYSMLPRQVANELREGRNVAAGEFSAVTILFSDIVRFTDMCSQCQPIQIVHLLNEMYVRFDELTSVHGVYKVETIGDAYMVVGGVPIPDDEHALKVASFALDQVQSVCDITSPISGDPIRIRVGMHTGPVVAGVVGVKMPRYCLFGDTVNTSSRMESNGIPGKIHCSEPLARLLDGKPGVSVEARGQIEIKGKGKMTTYFIIRGDQDSKKVIVTVTDDVNGDTADGSKEAIKTSNGEEIQKPAIETTAATNNEMTEATSNPAMAAGVNQNDPAPSKVCVVL